MLPSKSQEDSGHAVVDAGAHASADASADASAEADTPPQPAELGWTDETSARGLAGISTSCRNASFGDLDGDGDPDLVVPGPFGVRLFRNDGTGHFTQWQVLPVGTIFSGMQQCATALEDLDGDGRLDIALGIDEEDRPLGVYFNEGASFTAVFPQPSQPQPKLVSFCLGVARGTEGAPTLLSCREIQGDASMITFAQCGYDSLGIDVLCPSTVPTPHSVAWQFHGRTITESTDPVLSVTGNSQGLGISDLDGDGRDDIVMAIDFSDQFGLRGGATGFDDVSHAWGLDLFGHGMGVALGDTDGDGRTDVVLTTMGGFIEFQGLSPAGFAYRGKSSVYETHRRNIWPWTALLADLDDNGWLDLFVANEYASSSQVDAAQWLQTLGGPADFVGAYDIAIFRNGSSSYVESQLPYDTLLPHHGRGQSYSLADVDGDGHLDMALLVMRDDGTRNFDLTVGKLAGFSVGHGLTVRFSGAAVPAGTTATLSCGGRTQTRTLYAAEGTGTAARREAHFGCGEATSFDSLHVAVKGGKAIDVPAGSLDRAITIAL